MRKQHYATLNLDTTQSVEDYEHIHGSEDLEHLQDPFRVIEEMQDDFSEVNRFWI